jgi:hypothetical protein
MHRTSAQSAGLDLPPDLTLMGTMFDVIADIRQVLTEQAREACPSCSAIGHALDERIPGPPGGLPSFLPGEADTHPVSVLARRLAAGELFTNLAGQISGEPISARVVRDGRTVLTPAEREQLMAALDGSRLAVRRRGELRTARSDRLCARVTSMIIPGRVWDPDALRELEVADTPLGTVLERLGGWREPLWTWPFCSDDVVINSCGRLWLPRADGGRIPVGLATEQVLRLDWWAAA